MAIQLQAKTLNEEGKGGNMLWEGGHPSFQVMILPQMWRGLGTSPTLQQSDTVAAA